MDHGFDIIRGLSGIDFAGCDVVEVIWGYDPVGVTPAPAASVASEVASLMALRRLGCKTEAR